MYKKIIHSSLEDTDAEWFLSLGFASASYTGPVNLIVFCLAPVLYTRANGERNRHMGRTA
jgi:hypothetical protein